MFRLPFQIRSKSPENTAVQIASVEVHDIETSTDKRARTLKHLIRANHVNHAILFNNRRFHNHLPHILGSAYLFDSDHTHLTEIYDVDSHGLDPWEDSPGEVSRHDWRDYLGDTRYERAFIDFFEDELVRLGYDWKTLVAEYLFSGKQPMISGIVGGLGHPLIHMGYAFELSNATIAIEALGLTALCYGEIHKYLDEPSYTRPSPHPTKSAIELLQRLQTDERFDNVLSTQGPSSNAPVLFQHHEDLLLEYWNSWTLTDPTSQFEESQRAAVLMFVGTVVPGHTGYDFFLVHLLTTSHAVRILLPFIPKKFHLLLVREWWLFVLSTYISQLRPVVKDEYITDYELEGRDWSWVDKTALTSRHRNDAHYVKGLRAMKEAARTWGDEHDWYLRAAVRYADEFESWTGFGPEGEEA
ncbi:MAG: hypothetical protein M1816_003277 [Peltula sp. TS41687]|nr:MAG: hypothetical protein M1816_003277 [Peltula sp. TS41687]